MRRRLSAIMVATAASAMCSALVVSSGVAAAVVPERPAGANRAGGAEWGRPERLAGTGPRTAVLSVSCSAVGACSLGGTGFVDTETKGKWARAMPVPGTGGRDVQWSVSCRSPGDCGAAGNDEGTVYLATEKGGTWRPAQKLAGPEALDGRSATVDALSCGAVGYCVAGGSVAGGSGHTNAFVVAAKGGVWGRADEVLGLAALDTGGYASLGALSCPSAGNCTGGGLYTDGSGSQQAFVISQVGGRWRAATGLPGMLARNRGGFAALSAVSCPAPGDCAAGGIYTDGGYDNTAFVVDSTSGAWKSSVRLGGVNGLSPGPSVGIDQISCSSAGNCGAGGFYTDAEGRQQAFVVAEADGKWADGEAVPGTVARNTGLSALVASVSCRSAGNCAAGGLYTLVSGHSVVFVLSETKGVWGEAKEIGGVGADDSLYSVSCAATAACVAGLGARPDSDGESYVLAESPGR